METKNRETLDVTAMARFFKQNWYWFVITTAFFVVAFGFYYASKQKTYTIEMAIQLHSEEESILLPASGLVSTANKPTEAGDEKAVIISWDVIKQAIDEGKLNALYLKKRNLRWMEQNADWSELQATWTDDAMAELYEPLKITFDVKKDNILIRTQCGRAKAKYTINSLAEPWTSPDGFTIAARKELKPGNKYQVVILPTGFLIGRYDSDFKTDYPRRSKQIVELSATTKYPYNTIAIMRKQIEVYNRVTFAQRQALNKQTIAALDKRIDETTNSQLKLMLMQRREDKILALDAAPQPATIISSPHTTDEAVSPSLKILAMMALILGMGIPFATMYIIFVIRSHR